MYPQEETVAEKSFHAMKKHVLHHATAGAIGIVYIDLLLGLVGLANGAMRMVRTKSWYPYLVPSDLVEENESTYGPFSRPWILMGLDLTSVGLVIFALILFLGVLTKRSCLVNFWYCPNVIFMGIHGVIVIVGSFTEFWGGYAVLFAFIAFRIINVVTIYKYLEALSFFKSEERGIRRWKREIMENETHKKQPNEEQELTVLQQHASIHYQVKDISDDIFAKIDEMCRNDDVEILPPTYVDTRNQKAKEFNESVYHSYASSKLRGQY